MTAAWSLAAVLVRLWLTFALLLGGGASAGAVPRHGPPEIAALSQLLGRPVVLCRHDDHRPAPDRPAPLGDCCGCGLCHLLQSAVDVSPSSTIAPHRTVLRSDRKHAVAVVAPAPRSALATGPRGPPKLG